MKLRLPIQDESGLLRHGALLVAGTFVGALCNAGFHMVVGREAVLPNAEYGSLVAMLGIILAISTPMLAVQNTLAHYISRLVKENRQEESLAFFLHWVRMFAVISGGIVAGAVIFRAPLAAFWGGVAPSLIVVTFAVLAASLWMNLFYGLLQGLQSFVWLAWAPQAWGATRLVLGALFTIFISATALAAITAQGIGVVAVLVLCLWAIRGLRKSPNCAPVQARETYSYLVCALLCLAGYATLMNVDTALAKHYFAPEVVGRFAKAATIARIAVFLPVPIATVLFPKVTSTGDLPEDSWRLLLRALAFASLLIAVTAAVCIAFPQLPWTILYGAIPPESAAEMVTLTRAMVLAMCPLALAYLLLNFEMAQHRFRWSLGLLPCAIAYLGGVALWHDRPTQIPLVLGVANLAALAMLIAGILRNRKKS